MAVVDQNGEFIELLNNQQQEIDRDKGLLLLVGPARDLRPLEESCFGTEQTYNNCVTARYTIAASTPERVFGTLVWALANDLLGIGDDRDVSQKVQPVSDIEKGQKSSKTAQSKNAETAVERPYGVLRPEPLRKGSTKNTAPWHGFRSLGDSLLNAFLEDQKVSFDALKKNILGTLGSSPDGPLEVGQRFVLFLELFGDVDDLTSWEIFLREFAPMLPYRTVLTIAGLPEEVGLEPDDRNQRRLNLEVESVDPLENSEKSISFRDNAALSDEPVKDDTLDRLSYARALAQMVLHPQTQPPITIGIHGPWGLGKSSFMEQVEDQLKELNESDEDNNPLVLVQFNAWLYNDATQVWAGLLNAVSAKMEEKLGYFGTFWYNLKDTFTQRKGELAWALALPLIILVAAILLGQAYQVQMNAGNNGGEWIPILGVVGSLLMLLQRIASVTQPISRRIAHFARLPSYSEELGFQHAVIDDLKSLRKELERPGVSKSDGNDSGSRIVVFIDDLDRCEEERIMEILQAIILVLTPAKFYVFLGIDTEMIYRAIEHHYTRDVEKKPTRSFSRGYIKKILQLSFHLPTLTEEGREKLLNSLFSAESVEGVAQLQKHRDLGDNSPEPGTLVLDVDLLLEASGAAPADLRVEEVSMTDTPSEVLAFRDYKAWLGDNPRDIKRAVNVHRLMKIMLQNNGLRSGGWSEQDQRRLIRWVLFCICWPELVGYALELARSGKSSNDLLTDCAEKYEKKVEELDRRRRLSMVNIEKGGDELPPEVLGLAYEFVARSAILVDDVRIGEEETTVTDKKSRG